MFTRHGEPHVVRLAAPADLVIQATTGAHWGLLLVSGILAFGYALPLVLDLLWLLIKVPITLVRGVFFLTWDKTDATRALRRATVRTVGVGAYTALAAVARTFLRSPRAWVRQVRFHLPLLVAGGLPPLFIRAWDQDSLGVL
jgi:hypothetical protein